MTERMVHMLHLKVKKSHESQSLDIIRVIRIDRLECRKEEKIVKFLKKSCRSMSLTENTWVVTIGGDANQNVKIRRCICDDDIPVSEPIEGMV